MRAHCLQHVPFEGLGSIAPWLQAQGYEVTYTRFFETTDLPDVRSIDFLVILGGPMSVKDEGRYPWLVSEKRFIRDYIASGKPALGICLGAQLIASALGARVFQNPVKEIGWFPVHGLHSGEGEIFVFPPSEMVFHWHGETFDLPEGAIRIARSIGCENQAFQLGKNVIALQFHLETTPESAREIVLQCRDELTVSPYIQREEDILSADSERYASINGLMGSLLGFLLSSPGAGCGRQNG